MTRRVNKKARAALAAFVGKIATESLGIPAELTQDVLPDCLEFRLERFETMRGQVWHLSLAIWEDGELEVHIQFSCGSQPDLATISPHSGKWNHYLGADRETIARDLPKILAEVVPIAATRADQPDPWEHFYRLPIGGAA